MELTEKAVARPDEDINCHDFTSRIEWYRKTYGRDCPEGTEVPKRKAFIQLYFLCKRIMGSLEFTSELVPPEDFINHCGLIREYHLKTGGYFKWTPALDQQLAACGIKDAAIPDCVVEERSWRLAQNDKSDDKYEYGQVQELQGIPESERQDAG